MIDERNLDAIRLCPPATPQTSLPIYTFSSFLIFFHWVFCFFSQKKSNFDIVKLYNKKIYFKFDKLKLKTAAVGVNLDSLMVRFSFMRDCGSIPHQDSTVSTFFSIFKR